MRRSSPENTARQAAKAGTNTTLAAPQRADMEVHRSSHRGQVMRTQARAITRLVIAAASAVWAQEAAVPLTRVSEIGLYGCPIHTDIPAIWPYR